MMGSQPRDPVPSFLRTGAAALRERRTALGLTQAALAERLGASQSRVAKMEASDPTVSVDLLIRGLLGTGAREKEIARAISGVKRSAA